MKDCCRLARQDMEWAMNAHGNNVIETMKSIMWQVANAHCRYCDALHAPSEPETKP